MQVEQSVHGMCPDCNEHVIGGEGVTIDPEGQAWHADCRRVWARKNRQQPAAVIDDTVAVKRGPGRPRKAEATA